MTPFCDFFVIFCCFIKIKIDFFLRKKKSYLGSFSLILIHFEPPFYDFWKTSGLGVFGSKMNTTDALRARALRANGIFDSLSHKVAKWLEQTKFDGPLVKKTKPTDHQTPSCALLSPECLLVSLCLRTNPKGLELTLGGLFFISPLQTVRNRGVGPVLNLRPQHSKVGQTPLRYARRFKNDTP